MTTKRTQTKDNQRITIATSLHISNTLKKMHTRFKCSPLNTNNLTNSKAFNKKQKQSEIESKRPNLTITIDKLKKETLNQKKDQ